MLVFLPPLLPTIKISGHDLDSAAELIANISNWLLFAAIAGSIIMLIVGAYYYILSMGNTDKATRGKTIIYWAIIGMIVVILAKVIINFALDLVSANRGQINSEKPVEIFK